MRKILAALSASALLIGGWLAVSTVMAPTSPPALETGPARTPPMGFNNWNMTGCSADFNEATVRRIADLLVTTGLKDAGYEYVNIDDCWAEPQRNSEGDLVPHRTRFPNGIKAVADYVHAKGLEFGIYADAGTMTCSRDGGFPARWTTKTRMRSCSRHGVWTT